MSCRVAKKHIEKAVLSWICKKENIEEIHIKYVKTPKNTPIRDSLEEAGFSFLENGIMVSTREILMNDEDIITIKGK